MITEGTRGIVKHYLQDVGSTFGVGANGPHDWNEGWEYLYEGGATRRAAVHPRARPQPVADGRLRATTRPSGASRATAFDPLTWKPRVPTAAYIEMRDDDAFWAARRVMAFSDELIRAIVKTGQYSDPQAEQHLADVLIKRRDKIGQAYLPKINPIVDPAFDGTHVDVRQRRRPAPGCRGAGDRTPPCGRGSTTPPARRRESPTRRARSREVAAPSGLPTAPDSFVKVALSAQSTSHPSWAQPIDVYFRRVGTGWKLVGLERMPDGRCSARSRRGIEPWPETPSRSSSRIWSPGRQEVPVEGPRPWRPREAATRPGRRRQLADGISRLADLQERLYAQDKWGVLLIFQAMDAAGKDGAIKHVMSGINPQGCQVFSFKAPSSEDLDHDFLWRTSKSLPERGRIGIFNRSYYEEVLVVRVHPTILAKQKLPEQPGLQAHLGRALRRHRLVRALHGPQRLRHPQVLPERLARRSSASASSSG